MIASVNPFTGETGRVFEPYDAAEIERRVQWSSDAFRTHSRTAFRDRADALQRAAGILEAEKRRFALLMTEEMGKTLTSAEAEVAKCATACAFYAAHGETALAPVRVATDAADSYYTHQPLGPVLAIMPWNFPFWQVFRFAAPALMAGNTGLLKHASNVPQCALAIEEIFTRAGFAPGVFQALLIEADGVERLIADDRIAAVTLTGSEPAGRAVAAQAGKHIKKTVLELGGSDPFLVLPSADLKAAIETAVRARMVNTGQSCIAAKRFIVAEEIYDRFEAGFVQAVRTLRVGNPMDPGTEIGPLASERLLADLEKQVARAVADGAHVLTGGRRYTAQPCTYEPTVLTGIARENGIFHEELFGPVAMLFRVRDAAEAIALANDSPFGLGASVWTRDAAEQTLCITELQSGAVFVNAMVASDARLPFGGVKRSGYGRELGEHGIREFTNIKTVYVR